MGSVIAEVSRSRQIRNNDNVQEGHVGGGVAFVWFCEAAAATDLP